MTYGDPRSGTARRAVLIGGVEHVGVLFDPQTHREAAAWFDGAFGRPAAGHGVGLNPVRRAGSAMLLHLAAVLSFGAIASLLLRRTPDRGRTLALPMALVAPAIAVVVAIVGMALLPRGWLPLAVAGPLAVFFGVVGVLTLAAARLKGRAEPGRPPVVAAVGLVVLVAPLIAALLVWQGVQSAALRACRAPTWLTALVGGVLLAWPLAVTMPIT